MSDPRPPLVVLANDPWHSQWRRKQQLASRIAAFRPVYYCDPPRSALDLLRRRPRVGSGDTRSVSTRGAGAALTRDPSGVRILRGTLGIPGERFSGPLQLLNARLQRARALRDLRGRLAGNGVRSPIVLATWPLLGPWRAYGARMLIYDAIDDYAALSPSRCARERIARAMDRLAAEADLTIVTGEPLAERLAPHARRLEILPQGVDVAGIHPEAWRGTPFEALRELPGPKAVFHGTLDRRLDRGLLIALARAGVTLLLAGESPWSRAQWHELEAAGDVRYLGLLDASAVGGLMASADVGLIPYRPLPGMESAQTLKRLEYYAAGLPVVATDMEPYRRHAGEIALASGPAEFVAAVLAAAREPGAGRERRLAIAAENSWEERARRLEAWLQG